MNDFIADSDDPPAHHVARPITVAVVIPALDAADTIGRQIRAVLGDRDDNVELVLVDNGSTDDTLEVMRAATEGHDRITIVEEPRRGVNRARNAGIAATDAPLVLLCDADDEIEPGWIAELVTALDSVDLVGGAARPVDREGATLGASILPDRDTAFDWWIPSPLGASCGLHRAIWEGIGGFDDRLSGGGDEQDFFLRAQIDGATFTWAERAIVRYTQRDDPEEHLRRRWHESWRNLGRTYWHGRLRGWPRAGHLIDDLVKCALLVPLAPFSAHWRSVLRWRCTRRWRRFRALAELPTELRRRVGAESIRAVRFTVTARFRWHWRRIDRVEGWLTRGEAAALHAAAARVPVGQAIVEIGSWRGRSTAALALGCRRGRPVYAVDPHTGGRTAVENRQAADSLEHFRRTVADLELDNVVPVIERSAEAAGHYTGPPVGLLFIDGWHSTEAVIEDYTSWDPHMAPEATVIFHERIRPEVRTAIFGLRPSLPRRMLEFPNLTVFADA